MNKLLRMFVLMLLTAIITLARNPALAAKQINKTTLNYPFYWGFNMIR